MQPGDQDINPYLQQEVLGASPVRLRLMLITRAEELCALVEHLWSANDDSEAQAWLLRIRDILGELLSGVNDASHPLSGTITDFYVFLLQMVTRIETQRDVASLQQLKGLLAIESETWRQVLQREMSGEAGAEPLQSAVGNLAVQDRPQSPAPSQHYFQSQSDAFTAGSFSVEA